VHARLPAIFLAVLVPCCRRPLQPHAAGMVVSVNARLLPATADVREVVASAGGAVTASLIPNGAGELQGILPLEAGPATIDVRAVGKDDAPLGTARASLAASRNGPAQLFVTLDVAHAPASAPLIESLAVPGSSFAVGERVPFAARIASRAGDPIQIAWSASPAGCGSFADPLAAATRWTASKPGTCTISLAATANGKSDARSFSIVVRSRGQDYRYPLRDAPGRRHLVDQRGTGFLIKGEAAWLALVNLDEREQEEYLAARGANGFNLVEVMLVNHDYTTRPNPLPPANRYAEQPFSRPGDFSTPNDAYFDRAVAFVRRAAGHGIVVLLAPLYLGFDGGREGWWQELSGAANTREVCLAYGRYVGRKFKDSTNILWLAGGDFAPPADSEGEARYLEIVRGIREAGASQLWTGHWNFDHLGGISTDEKRLAGAMDLNGVYQYGAPWRYVARAYAVLPTRPAFLVESAFEREHPRSDLQPFRKAWWWSMASGASGVVWGNNFLWMCEAARGRYPAKYSNADGTVSSWAAERESPGSSEVLHLHGFFEGIPWERLVPSGVAGGGAELVTSGKGSEDDRIVAAATAEGDLLVAYVPPDGTAPRRFGLDLSRFRRPARARWYDPSTGAFLPARLPQPVGGTVELETPGANGSGVNDWALLLEAPASG
jgi:hypothetical protein